MELLVGNIPTDVYIFASRNHIDGVWFDVVYVTENGSQKLILETPEKLKSFLRMLEDNGYVETQYGDHMKNWRAGARLFIRKDTR